MWRKIPAVPVVTLRVTCNGGCAHSLALLCLALHLRTEWASLKKVFRYCCSYWQPAQVHPIICLKTMTRKRICFNLITKMYAVFRIGRFYCEQPVGATLVESSDCTPDTSRGPLQDSYAYSHQEGTLLRQIYWVQNVCFPTFSWVVYALPRP